MVGFGEVCLAKLNKHLVAHDAVPKLAARWCRALFLGYDRDSNEYMMYGHGRVLRTRALQRVPFDQRWSPEALQEVHLSPYALYRRPCG